MAEQQAAAKSICWCSFPSLEKAGLQRRVRLQHAQGDVLDDGTSCIASDGDCIQLRLHLRWADLRWAAAACQVQQLAQLRLLEANYIYFN